MLRISFLFIGALLAYASGDDEFLQPLEDMKGLSLRCDTEEKLAVVRSYENHQDFDFLSITGKLGDEIKVLVVNRSLNEFTTVLTDHKIDYTIFIENVLKEIEDDYDRNEISKTRCFSIISDLASGIINDWIDFYPRYDDILKQLKGLNIKYSRITALQEIGTSYERRPIWALKISSNPAVNKPAILIEAGMHAHEWVTPVTALNIINQLVTNPKNSQYYEKVDWYFIPSLNPDGYEFTHTRRRNRLWRKTRSTNPGSSCIGTDLNRNFPFKWMGAGASNNPCHDTYAGSEALSETESKSLWNFVVAKNGSIKAYISLHASGRKILYPWGFTTNTTGIPQFVSDIAMDMSAAIYKLNETSYEVGSIANVKLPETGGSADWARAQAGISLSYMMYLPGGGSLGYNPTQKSLKPIGEEVLEGLKVIATYVSDLWG